MASELSKEIVQSDGNGSIVVTKDNAPQVHAAAAMAIARSLDIVCSFIGGQTLPGVMQAAAKSKVISSVIAAAIDKLGFDAARFKTFEVEIPHLVDAVFKKIEEREVAAKCGVEETTLDAEEQFRKWAERVSGGPNDLDKK